MNHFMSFCIGVIVCFSSFSQDSIVSTNSSIIDRIPFWARGVIEKSSLVAGYEILEEHNPFYLEADFNGDDLVDIAFHVKNRIGGKQGVLIINRGTNNAFIMGAGKDIGMGTDITWCKNWFVYRDKTVYNHAKKKKVKVFLRNPALEIVKSEESSIILYWDKRRYKTLIKYL